MLAEDYTPLTQATAVGTLDLTRCLGDGSEVVELRAVRQTRKVLYMGPVPASLPACNSVLTRSHQTRR
jgi:hypothetical protein